MKHSGKILSSILLMGFLLRLVHLQDKAFGTDEFFSIQYGRLAVEYGIFKDFAAPPGFYAFCGFVLKWTHSLLCLRLIMVMFGMAAVYVVYLLARKTLDEKVALAAAFLLSVNPMHIVLSQHIRVYVLLMLVFLVSVFFLFQFMTRKSAISLVLLMSVYALALYLHYVSAVFIASQMIYFFVVALKKGDFPLAKKYLLGLPLLGFLTLPLIQNLVTQFFHLMVQEEVTKYAVLEKLGLSSILKVPNVIYKYSVMMDATSLLQRTPFLLVIAPVVFAAFLLGMFKLHKNHTRGHHFIIMNFLLPFALFTLLGFLYPLFYYRYVSYLLPLYIIPVSGVILYGRRGWMMLGIISILWLTVAAEYLSMNTMENWAVHFGL